MPISLSGSLNLSGSLTTTGTITATTLVVQTITSSISSITGSTNFGSLSSDKHTFTGSINASGSGNFLGSITAGGSITTTLSQATSTDINVTNTNTANGAMAQISAINGGASQIDMVAFGSGSTGTLYGITKSNLKVIRDNSLTAQSNGLAIGTDAAVPFYVFTNSVERMRITSAGSVGISTSNTTYGTLNVLSKGGNLYNGLSVFSNNGTESLIGFGCDGTLAGIDVTYGATGAYQQFVIRTGGNTRMTIQSSTGDVYIGTATLNKTSRLVVYGETTDSSQFAIRAFSVGSDVLLGIRNDGLLVTGTLSLSPYNYSVTGRAMYVNSGGVVGYNSSTRESKNNINSLQDISWIHNLNPVTFNKRKKDNEGNYTDEVYDELDYGLIADEVEKVNTDFVFYDTDKDGIKKLAGVGYEKLVPVLVKAIQELTARVQYLENK